MAKHLNHQWTGWYHNLSRWLLSINNHLQALHQNIISGTFNNPVNQNNPCLSGNITYSACQYANGGRITYTACSVYQSGSAYTFTAIYYLYTSSGQLIQQGTVNATM